ncbi:unnamed protein product [Cyclocybe aegerita]|uniref:Uncharacterized protein n=1 Tax=Cyclocybe aegerita TaxID=1973307 RepID=A0A8S0VWA4_CYCAE|nr:unnamed protein product [Cyclocybe aegerita]
MFDYLPQPHLFPHNPYPFPPPPIAHKVWILDCASCGLFLTNRGMKAVLLLRPNVSLFSSDTLPVNCSPYTASTDPLRPAHAHKPHTSPSPSRTCECLTQTLCCHGCGSNIGYMIVVPCTRCTSSITATNRATNGHRFVFHSSEVAGTERHYIKNEAGVSPFDPSPPPPPPNYFSYHSHPLGPYPPHAHDYAHPRAPSPVFRRDFLPTPPLEYAGPILGASRHREQLPDPDAPQYYRVHPPSHYTHAYTHAHAARAPPLLVPAQRQPPSPSNQLPSPVSPGPTLTRSRSRSHSRSQSPSPSSSSSSSESDAESPPPLISPTFSNSGTLPTNNHTGSYLADHKEPPPAPAPTLQPGDIVFWHHLARTGEIAGVEDDRRARGRESARDAGRFFLDR